MRFGMVCAFVNKMGVYTGRLYIIFEWAFAHGFILGGGTYTRIGVNI